MHYESTRSAGDCAASCVDRPECGWASFDPRGGGGGGGGRGGLCTLTRGCADTEPCPGCQVSSRFCHLTEGGGIDPTNKRNT